MRKGVKPSGNVVTKEELARIQAEKEARAEAARKAAAAAPPKPAPSTEAPARAPMTPRPAGPPPQQEERRPPYRAPGPPLKDAGDRRDRPSVGRAHSRCVGRLRPSPLPPRLRPRALLRLHGSAEAMTSRRAGG